MEAFDQAFTDGVSAVALNVKFEDLYRKAYNLVLHKFGELLYRELEERFRQHAPTTPQRSKFQLVAEFIRDTCKYLDRTLVGRLELTPIYDLAMRIFDERAAYRKAAVEHWQHHAAIVGKCALALQDIYTEVSFRPQHSGAKRSRDEFEACASANDAALSETASGPNK